MWRSHSNGKESQTCDRWLAECSVGWNSGIRSCHVKVDARVGVFLVLFRLISWIAFLRSFRGDPRNHTNKKIHAHHPNYHEQSRSYARYIAPSRSSERLMMLISRHRCAYRSSSPGLGHVPAFCVRDYFKAFLSLSPNHNKPSIINLSWIVLLNVYDRVLLVASYLCS